MTRFIGFALVLAVFGCMAPVMAQEKVEPAPAWCGGSWWPGVVDQNGGAVEPAGVSFGDCKPVMKKDGDKEVSVPTYPAYPASKVTYQQDSAGKWLHGMMVVEKDKDGKEASKFMPIVPLVRQKTAEKK